MSAPPAISLPRFEGPLDLLLALVRQHQVEITEIPIAEITRQYLDYLYQAQKLDLDLGSEFACMAATLIHIKARSLLPTDPAVVPDEADPRQELVRQLLDHEQLRQAAEFLRQKLELSQSTWSLSPIGEPAEDEGDELQPSEAMSLYQVLELAQKALEIARAHQTLHLSHETITVPEMIDWLQPQISELPKNRFLLADTLLAEQNTMERKSALFLAILEMAKAGTMKIRQMGLFDPIYLFNSKTALK